MKRAYLFSSGLFQFLTAAMLLSHFLLAQSKPVPLADPSARSASDPKAQGRILDSYGKLPLSFEANQGQADSRVKFLSRTGGYTLFLTGDEAVIALNSKRPAPKGAGDFHALPVSLKRYPDTTLRYADTKQRYPDTKSSVRPTSERTAGGVLRLKLRNANPAARVSGVDEMAGTSNYFIGNDPAKWRTKVPTYAKVKYEGIYSGIDLVYYGNQRQLEYDFIVAPGADPRRIAFDVRGAKRIRRDAQGELVFKVGEDEIRWHKPVVYQEKDRVREVVAARYVVAGGNRVGFEVGKYDAGRTLYIDPLIYSTYLGGSGSDYSNGIALDGEGNAYLTGFTSSTAFPTTPGAFETTCCGAFVTKINPQGTALVYSTYLDNGYAYGIAVDSSGNAYVTGATGSADFPVTPGAFQPVYGGGDSDAFVSKINPDGSALIYSTYLGGSGLDQAAAIAVDSAGNAHVTGYTESTNFPTMNPQQPNYGGNGDAFVAMFNSDGSGLVYSTYLGGSGSDEGYGIAVDEAGDTYVTGGTESTNFPITPGAFQVICNGGSGCNQVGGDAFVTKINPSGSALVYSTYLGGGGTDFGLGIAVDISGNAYVTGATAGINFPTTPGAFQAAYAGCNYRRDHDSCGDAFITKLNSVGSALVYSSYLGGANQDWGRGIAVDSAGNAYVTGFTASIKFPVTPSAFQKKCGNPNYYYCANAFVTKFSSSGSALAYSTYLGGSVYDFSEGIAVDSSGNAYVTGYTTSTNFPTMNPLQAANGGGYDAFVAKISMVAVTTTTLSSSPNPSTFGQPVTFAAVVTSSAGAPQDGETVSFMKGKTVLGTRTLSGGSASFTTSTLKVGTNSITAVYGGDSNFAGSKSKAVKQVVQKAAE